MHSRQARSTLIALISALLWLGARAAGAQSPVSYRLAFPSLEHHEMQVEIDLTDLPAGALDIWMSRSSPGRYSLHEFAKNVVDVRATDPGGTELALERTSPSSWRVSRHGDRVRVTYRVFGDRADGTYLGIDTTHAHINIPAALMWAKGLETRPAVVHLNQPPGKRWQVATQLFPTRDPLTFTAPNLAYLVDSPIEFGPGVVKTFTVRDGSAARTFRFVAHHDGTDDEVSAFVRDVEAIVREEQAVFGEFAPYDGGVYTFLADYLPWVDGDAMEHRNSTVMTSRSSIADDRFARLDTVAHEFFHSWNVERIRPASLEPFDLTAANMSGELWLAEGFTNYYGSLATVRAGIASLDTFLDNLEQTLNAVVRSPGRQVRSAVEVSQMAPFVDAAVSIDRTDFGNTYLSYYTWGEAIASGLDLTLRSRSDGRVTLDDVMRALWTAFGKPGGRQPGVVDRPYTLADVEATLATVAGDAAFARDFVARFINGHDVVDYTTLLARAGFVVRPAFPGRGFAGLTLQDTISGARIVDPPEAGTPAYRAGLDVGVVVTRIAGQTVSSASQVANAIASAVPGSRVQLEGIVRGERLAVSLDVVADPRFEIVPVERIGQALTDEQRRFRDAWLDSAVRGR